MSKVMEIEKTKDYSNESTFSRAFYNGNGKRLTYGRLIHGTA